MAVPFQNTVRRIVPRWHSFAEARDSAELDPITLSTSPKAETTEFLQSKEEQWRSSKELFFALDLLNAANVLGVSPGAKEAAEFVLRQREGVTPIARKIARRILGKSEPVSDETSLVSGRQASGQLIKETKERRILEPRNAFVWSELARLYALIGLPEQARRPMQIAIILAPQNRFIIRSATRFFLHINEPDRALSLLRSSEYTAHDPWLMAAEIAVSSVLEKTPRFVKEARAAKDNKNIDPLHISEMAAALASLEMWAGNDKRATKTFMESLTRPTENTLAQVVWAANMVGLSKLPFDQFKVPNAFEAQALDARSKSDWKNAIIHCDKWATAESFSSRPYSIASSIATSLLGEHADAELIAKMGLMTNPAHPGLLNNIAFAQAEQGKPNEAAETLNRVDLKKANTIGRICLLATSGLISFKLGKPEDGRASYEAAISLAHRLGMLEIKATAQMYLARELAKTGGTGFHELLEAGSEKLKASSDPFARALAKVISEDMRKISEVRDQIAKP
jgi:tetratricopeptide (TPR) repeat protein